MIIEPPEINMSADCGTVCGVLSGKATRAIDRRRDRLLIYGQAILYSNLRLSEDLSKLSDRRGA